MAFTQDRMPQRPAAHNPTILALLKSQCPAKISEEQLVNMMHEPMNRALYPIRITQAMLDTIDVQQLDRWYHYLKVD